MDMKKFFTILLCAAAIGIGALKTDAIVEPRDPKNYAITDNLRKQYANSTKDINIIESLELLKNTAGEYSRKAILGDNLTGKPIKIEFRNLAEVSPQYANFDALGWKKSNRLYIYINQKHFGAPKQALSALLAHEAIHQDEFNSLNEETYAWTLEAAVWTQLIEDNPEVARVSHPLVERQNTIHKLFVKGGYTDEYIRKSVTSNAGYKNLPSRSPGFEDRL